jgi:hypothetical protein
MKIARLVGEETMNGRIGKRQKVATIQEAHDICEARNKASGDDVGP